MATFVNVNKEDILFLLKEGFTEEPLKTLYELIRLRGPVVIILFNSKKLLIQGKDEKVKYYSELLEQTGLKRQKEIKFKDYSGIVIGSDESFKGDTFGGLVVAAVKANDAQRQMLKFAGALDSKKLNDFEIPIIAERIQKIADYKILVKTPKEYNKENVTDLLNKMHFECVTSLGKADLIVVDKYPGCNVGSFETKAESKYVEVAAASILARNAGLKQLKELSKKVGFELPKGSTHVDKALLYLKNNNYDLSEFAKITFKNVAKYI